MLFLLHMLCSLIISKSIVHHTHPSTLPVLLMNRLTGSPSLVVLFSFNLPGGPKLHELKTERSSGLFDSQKVHMTFTPKQSSSQQKSGEFRA